MRENLKSRIITWGFHSIKMDFKEIGQEDVD
jgi:hypothetical protein